MIRATAVVLAMLVLAACSTVREPGDWRRPSASTQQITADDVECWRASQDAERTPDLILGGVLDTARILIEYRQRDAAYAACMRGKGYALTGDA